jgi:16S rRNA (uracil1498-N3)-methyltransferase
MRRFHHPGLADGPGEALLSESASHHLLRVTGIAPGEALGLYDGQGRSAIGRLLAVEAGRARVFVEAAQSEDEGRAPRHLCLALLKGPAFDTALRMATELGVASIRPVLARRSIARGEKEDRWRKVCAAAVGQSGGALIPEVVAPMSLVAVVAALPTGARRLLAAPGGAPLGPVEGEVALFIGPEGGWEPAELAEAEALGVEAVGLGPRVLRADTAVAAGLARLG